MPMTKPTYEVLTYKSRQAFLKGDFQLLEDGIARKRDALTMAKDALVCYPFVKVQSSDREFIEVLKSPSDPITLILKQFTTQSRAQRYCSKVAALAEPLGDLAVNQLDAEVFQVELVVDTAEHKEIDLTAF